MSIARQRREAAAALAILLEEKQAACDAAAEIRDDDAMQQAVVDRALVMQNNAKFIVFVLKTYAGTLLKLPGGKKPLHDFSKIVHDGDESLVDAIQTDNQFEIAEADGAKHH